jgi:hypothetical protein
MNMRKLINIIIASLAVLAMLSSCMKTEADVQVDEEKAEGYADFTFGLSLSDLSEAQTRSWGDSTLAKNLWVLTYDNSEDFVEYTKARFMRIGADGDYVFTARLGLASEPRTVHLVCSSSDNPAELFGDGVMDGSNPQIENMTASEALTNFGIGRDTDVWWQKVEFPDGISLSSSQDSALYHLQMVRNYARINISLSATAQSQLDSVVVSFANFPVVGTAAPYYDGFPDYVDGSGCATYDNLVYTQGYKGCEPADIDYDSEDDFYWYQNKSSSVSIIDSLLLCTENNFTVSQLVGERYDNATAENPLYIIIRAKTSIYSEGEGCYYKIDLLKDNQNGRRGDPIEILRNFNYNVVIDGVLDDGCSSVFEIVNSNHGSGLVYSVIAETFDNVSNGTSRLDVEYAAKAVVEAGAYSLKYRYIPDVSTGASDNGQVLFEYEDGDVVEAVANSSSVDEDGWSTATVTVKDPQETVASQSIYAYISGGLSKKITFYSRQPYSLESLTAPLSGGTYDVTFTLPEGIDKAFFPLNVYLESSIGSLSAADSDLRPVTLDESLSGSGKPGLAYMKTITYSEYSSAKTFHASLKPNRTSGYACTLYVGGGSLSVSSIEIN